MRNSARARIRHAVTPMRRPMTSQRRPGPSAAKLRRLMAMMKTISPANSVSSSAATTGSTPKVKLRHDRASSAKAD
jgi:hypothetical protein